MWVSAAMDGGDVIYTWDKTKEAIVAERIVPEWFWGILQCDGGSEIACFLLGGKGRKRPPPKIIRAGCWAHVRRKFFDAAEAGCSLARRLLKIINVLYRIEREAREARLHARRSCLALRQKRARRVMAGLRRRLDATVAAVRPKTPVGKACLYALGQWDALQVYLEYGEVPIDNNGRGERHPSLCGRDEKISVHWRCGRRPAFGHPLQPVGQLPAPRHQSARRICTGSSRACRWPPTRRCTR